VIITIYTSVGHFSHAIAGTDSVKCNPHSNGYDGSITVTTKVLLMKIIVHAVTAAGAHAFLTHNSCNEYNARCITYYNSVTIMCHAFHLLNTGADSVGPEGLEPHAIFWLLGSSSHKRPKNLHAKLLLCLTMCLIAPQWLQQCPRPDVTEGAYNAAQNPLVGCFGWGGASPDPATSIIAPSVHRMDECPWYSCKSAPMLLNMCHHLDFKLQTLAERFLEQNSSFGQIISQNISYNLLLLIDPSHEQSQELALNLPSVHSLAPLP